MDLVQFTDLFELANMKIEYIQPLHRLTATTTKWDDYSSL